MSKFKVGDVVRYTGRSELHQSWDSTIKSIKGESVTLQISQDYFSKNSDSWNGTWYTSENELRLAIEGGEEVKPYQRKTYRLLKDMPGYAKGTLFQEQCDDGTQPYSVIKQPGVDAERFYGVRLEFKDRKFVEENPKWFVEVFQVHPAYQTREELDQWEAFKSRKKPGRKAKVVDGPVTINYPAPQKGRTYSITKTGNTLNAHARRSAAMKASWARRKAAQKAA